MSTTPAIVRARSIFRVLGVSLASVVAIYSVWILIARLLDPEILRDRTFPHEIAQTELDGVRSAATMAAHVGVFRGDLWTMRSLVDAAEAFSSTSSLNAIRAEAGRSAAIRAVSLAPIEPRAWLVLAAIAARQVPSSAKVFEPLKMSYYTGPNERSLIAARFDLAMRSTAFEHPELADAMRREIRAILRAAPELRAVITSVYRRSNAPGREFIESAIAGIDATFLDSLRNGR